MVTVFIILSVLILINIFLLVFSCNDEENETNKNTSINRKNFFYKPTVSEFRITADK